MQSANNLSELKTAFRGGFISKSDYIKKASMIHDHFYDYSEVLNDCEVNEIRIRPGEVEFIVGELNLRIFCPRGESRYAPLEILNFGSYEPFESRILETLCLDADSIFDIGSNIGWYAVNFAALNPTCVIYAFEPLPTAHAYLKMNVTMNNFQNQIQIEKIALSDTFGKQKFVQPIMNSTNSSFVNVANSENVIIHEVESCTIDQYILTNNCSVDLVKCDVEGAEFQVFLGAEQSLRQFKPVIFTEILRKWSGAFGNHPNDLIQFLKTIGYSCFEVNDGYLVEISQVSEETTATNFLFLTDSEAHSSILSTFKIKGWIQN
jgi:FkbM family methyltransferase